MKQETLKRLQEILDESVAKGVIPGANLLVRKDGCELGYLESGMADREVGLPIRRDTIFRLYSMSKPITAAAVMQLFEQGKIDLCDPVYAYIPGFMGTTVEKDGQIVPAGKDATIKNLLDMTSGYRYNDGVGAAGLHANKVFEEVDQRLFGDNPMGTVEFAVRMSEGPAAFVPGERFLYGTSADILGAVVEAVSGQRFGEYLKEHIFEPLGMEDTGFYVPEEKQSRLVKAYDLQMNLFTGNHLGIINAMDRDPAFESGGAGLVSTVDDYAKFAQMLLNGGELNGKRILKQSTVNFMTAGSLTVRQEYTFVDQFSAMPGFSYGNLMRVMKHPGSSGALDTEGEYGWDGWLGCYFANEPQVGLTILVMMQRTDSGMTNVVRKLRNVIMSDILNQ